MKHFRIHIYLNIKKFFMALFFNDDIKNNDYKIKEILLKNCNKKNLLLTSQCRISFLLVLKYLKYKFSKRNEVIFSAYNLPEMISVAKNLNFKIILCDIDYNTGFYNLNKLKNKINKNTSAIILTNMFNSYEQSSELSKICKKKKVFLIEDNAIYFDNYKIINKKKIFSGSLGNFTLYSFNIMKNISALYGGAVTSNIQDFYFYSEKKLLKFKNFPKILLFRQSIIFFVLKLLSINFLYKLFFFKIVKNVHVKNIKFFLKLFYPGLKFQVKKFPSYYFTRISSLSKKLIFYQLIDYKKRKDNHRKRKLKNIYYYNKLYRHKISGVKLLKISDFNYQNFVDFPIIVKNRTKLINFLLNKGIEPRSYYYRNCEKIFNKRHKSSCINSKKYENQIICLPNHEKITFEYIDYIVKIILIFYSKSNNFK